VVTQLKQEWEEAKGEVERYNLTLLEIIHPQPPTELKEQGKGRKGGI